MLPKWYVPWKWQRVIFVGLALVGAGIMLWFASQYSSDTDESATSTDSAGFNILLAKQVLTIEVTCPPAVPTPTPSPTIPPTLDFLYLTMCDRLLRSLSHDPSKASCP